jgi:hypothetical protein
VAEAALMRFLRTTCSAMGTPGCSRGEAAIRPQEAECSLVPRRGIVRDSENGCTRVAEVCRVIEAAEEIGGASSASRTC